MKNSVRLSLVIALVLAGCATTQVATKWQKTIQLKTESPSDQVVELGGTARFSVSSKHHEGVMYQWLHGCEVLTNATSETLTISSITTNHAGYYTCVAYRGLDMQVSEPMQLITMERLKGTNGIIIGARPPIGLGGNVQFFDQTSQLRRVVMRGIDAVRENQDPYYPTETVQSTNSGSAAPWYMSGLLPISQLTLLMQSGPTNISGTSFTVSVATPGCPGPYSGYVRYTAGWYPLATGPWLATALWTPCSAIVADDRYRSMCSPSGAVNLSGWSPAPVTTRLHRFVAYFPPGSPPSPTTTYLLHLTRFNL